MKWQGRRTSSNVEDRRGMSGGGKLVGGGITGVIIVAIVTLLSGGSLGDVLGTVLSTNSGTVAGTQQSAVSQEQQEELSQFVSVVLADTEDVWGEVFKEQGMTYKNPTLVLYSGSVQSACGYSSSAVGPFYCPGDQKLYIDLSFYNELQSEFQAPGDFAMAYVIAHEVGHHVQTLLGTTDKYSARMQQDNAYQVRFELQADYLAGVWAHYAQDKNLLDVGDIDEALTAASAVGDDTLQKKAQGYAVPESFTHGSSEQRKRWFQKGFDSGTIEGGDTFGARSL
ncbi:metalloprotease [Paenibacillus spiritus]|uniref:Metalloprotease n=1 Tax=Paenibacillus spiritus TaxID=2496557 RepID=A0A5J5G9E2_9BACL|nr:MULTISPECIES: neutral zinc metallopeptidase [Paenibacillus]KAA9004231.1 metalloprotease [Paenibacillus spiritus]